MGYSLGYGLKTPVRIVITWKNHRWRPPKSFTLQGWQAIANFGKNMLGVELLDKLRMNLDYLIIGRFLGIEALGVYYFAFNARYGITINVINTFMSALFPYICAVRGDYKQFKQRYLSSLKKVTLVAVPFILIQSLLAPLYVPIVFGNKWASAVPILIMICLSVIPRIYAWASSLLLNAIDKTKINLQINAIFTAGFAITILAVVNWGIFWVAAAVFVYHLILMPAFTIWVHRYVFNQYLVES